MLLRFPGKFRKRHARASSSDPGDRRGCILASVSYVTPGMPASAAAAMIKSQSSTGSTPVRLRSDMVDAPLPINRPALAGPPKASISEATVSGVEAASGPSTESMANLYRISVGYVNRITVDNACEAPDMGDSNERLRKARKRAGFKSASAAAKRFGWTVSTYLSHENGQTSPVPTEDAAVYAKAFKVSQGWILTAQGPMEADRLVKLMGYIGAGAEISPEYEQVPPEGLEEIELPLTVGVDAIAFEVQGDSMLPRYEAGDLVVCSNGARNPDDFLRQFVAVRTSNGHRYLKKLRPGSRRGLYTLESFNAEPIENVKIAWIGEVLAIVPAHRRAVAPRKRAAG